MFHSDQDPRVTVATGGAQTDSTTDATPYSIAAGDVIGVKIWEDSRFSSNYTVRPDGRISVPLLGDISAAGLTPVQLESAINQAALKFLQLAHTAVQIEHGAQRPANAANRLNALVITIGPATGQYYITAEVTSITALQVESYGELKPVTFDPPIDKLTPFQTEMVALNLIGENQWHIEDLLRRGSSDAAYTLTDKARFR